MCLKVFNKSNWKSHHDFELYKRTGTRKLMRQLDGKYYCPLGSCDHKSSTDYKTIANHIKRKHDKEEFEKMGLKMEVSEMIILIFCRILLAN